MTCFPGRLSLLAHCSYNHWTSNDHVYGSSITEKRGARELL